VLTPAPLALEIASQINLAGARYAEPAASTPSGA